jgi:hypothetical protein
MDALVKPIVVVPVGTPEESIKALSDGGYIPLKSIDPDAVKIVVPGSEILGDDLMTSALHAIAESDNPHVNTRFIRNLWKRINAREDTKAS